MRKKINARDTIRSKWYGKVKRDWQCRCYYFIDVALAKHVRLFFFLSISLFVFFPSKSIRCVHIMLKNLLAQVDTMSFETCYEGKFRIEKPNMAMTIAMARKMCAELKKEIIFGKM